MHPKNASRFFFSFLPHKMRNLFTVFLIQIFLFLQPPPLQNEGRARPLRRAAAAAAAPSRAQGSIGRFPPSVACPHSPPFCIKTRFVCVFGIMLENNAGSLIFSCGPNCHHHEQWREASGCQTARIDQPHTMSPQQSSPLGCVYYRPDWYFF